MSETDPIHISIINAYTTSNIKPIYSVVLVSNNSSTHLRVCGFVNRKCNRLAGIATERVWSSACSYSIVLVRSKFSRAFLSGVRHVEKSHSYPWSRGVAQILKMLKGRAGVEIIHVAVDNAGVPNPITECVVSRWTTGRILLHFQTGERMGGWSMVGQHFLHCFQDIAHVKTGFIALSGMQCRDFQGNKG